MNKELKNERWKEISGLENKYQVSTLGRVRSIYRKKKFILLPGIMNGYLYFNLPDKKIRTVHRMVAEYFIDNPKKLPIVNHKNGVKTDNRVVNLEWCTHVENMGHARKNGLYGAKLSNAQVKKIRKIYKTDWNRFSMSELAKKYKVSKSYIWRIVNNERRMKEDS